LIRYDSFNYMFCIKIKHFNTCMEVKNNKMLFNLRHWFKFASLIFNSDYIKILYNFWEAK